MEPISYHILNRFFIFFIGLAIKKNVYALIPAFLIFGLLLQVHPTTIFVAPTILIACLYLFIKRRPYLGRSVIISILAFVLVSFPVILFDFRHEFLNTNLILSSFEKRTPNHFTFSQFVTSLGYTENSIQQEIVNVFTYGRNYANDREGQWMVLIPVVFILMLAFKRKSIEKKWAFLLLSPWLFYLVGFSLSIGDIGSSMQEGEVQLYYFLPVAIAYIFVLSYTLALLAKDTLYRNIIFTAILLYVIVSANWRYSFANEYSYGNKKKVAQFIFDHASGRPFSIRFNDRHGFGYLDGFRYLFSLYDKRNFQNMNNPTYIISIPPEKNYQIFGNIGIQVPEEYNGRKM